MSEPQVRNGCESEVVARVVERLREELVDRAWQFSDDHDTPEGYVSNALDCLVALAAGKQWPESEKR